MKLAFCLFRYFPWSGLARDFLRVVQECHRRGHDIHVYVREWQGERPAAIRVHVLGTSRLTNHNRDKSFYRRFREIAARQHFDVIIGFNRMPGLDMYYCADLCYASRGNKHHGRLYRWISPRFRHFQVFEQAVFGIQASTTILSLSEAQKGVYQEHYATPGSRFRPVPPNLDIRNKPWHQPATVRRKKRKELGLKDHQSLLLFVGSGFRTKGLDRAIRAMAALPATLRQDTRMLVVGQDRATRYQRLANRTGQAAKVRFLGGRDDVVELMAASDLLIHPARQETTGTVLLEAVVAGLPVLVTDVCGYAYHVASAQAGVVSESPFVQQTFDQELYYALTTDQRAGWYKNGIEYGANPGLYRMPETVSDLIEERAATRARLRSYDRMIFPAPRH